MLHVNTQQPSLLPGKPIPTLCCTLQMSTATLEQGSLTTEISCTTVQQLKSVFQVCLSPCQGQADTGGTSSSAVTARPSTDIASPGCRKAVSRCLQNMLLAPPYFHYSTLQCSSASHLHVVCPLRRVDRQQFTQSTVLTSRHALNGANTHYT